MCETENEALRRKQTNKLSMKTVLMCETENETLRRKQTIKLAMKRVRMCETVSKALIRKEIDNLSKKSVRMSETESEALNRMETKKLAMRTKTALSVTVENAISSFLSKVKSGPEYVCTVCHRLLYKSFVVMFNECKLC